MKYRLFYSEGGEEYVTPESYTDLAALKSKIRSFNIEARGQHFHWPGTDDEAQGFKVKPHPSTAAGRVPVNRSAQQLGARVVRYGAPKDEGQSRRRAS